MTEKEVRAHREYCTDCGTQLVFVKIRHDYYDSETGKPRQLAVFKCPQIMDIFNPIHWFRQMFELHDTHEYRISNEDEE